MTARIILMIVALSLLGACGPQDEQIARPREPDANSIGFFCRMGLAEHTGPKGQILPKGWTDPLWFSSVRDALTYAEMEVVSEREMAGFWVNDMAQGTWERPAAGSWIAAQEAWYAIDSRKASGMGGTRGRSVRGEKCCGRIREGQRRTCRRLRGGQAQCCGRYPASKRR